MHFGCLFSTKLFLNESFILVFLFTSLLRIYIFFNYFTIMWNFQRNVTLVSSSATLITTSILRPNLTHEGIQRDKSTLFSLLMRTCSPNFLTSSIFLTRLLFHSVSHTALMTFFYTLFSNIFSFCCCLSAFVYVSLPYSPNGFTRIL